MTYDIHDFIREALSKGKSRDEITKALQEAAWRKEDIEAALASYTNELAFGMPVPRQKPYLSAKEVFIYLLLYLCLYISAWSTGSILFRIINNNIQDPNSYSYGMTDLSGMRMATASLIITYPLFLWLSYATRRAARPPEHKHSRVRSALTYVTLFIGAGTMIGDGIALLYNFLEGELTLRFILKFLTVLVIAAIIFGYYLWDLKKEERV